MRHVLASLMILALPCSAAAQQSDTAPVRPAKAAVRRFYDPETLRRRPDIVEGKDLDAKTAWLARGRYVGMTVLTSADLQTTFLVVRRITSSQPEVHARWDDIVLVRSGTGVIIFGDSLVGSTLRAPGERRGGRFVTNYQIVVRAGDVVRIPAAVPHAFVVSGTEPLEYLVIKTRRQELPIRWTAER